MEILDLSSKKWSNSTKNFFLSKGFLSSYEKYHKNLKFIYAYFDSGIFHGQVINLNFLFDHIFLMVLSQYLNFQIKDRKRKKMQN